MAIHLFINKSGP